MLLKRYRPRVHRLQGSSSVVLTGIMSLLTGCIAGLPLQTESPSDHFDVKYVETHQRSTRQEVEQKLGIPDTILRFKEKTYYVYSARGDTRLIVGAVVLVPPFFVPFWAPKDEGDALHCLALVFDEEGLLQDYMGKTAPEEAGVGILTPYGPGGGPLREEVTECVNVFWDEEERRSLGIGPQAKEIAQRHNWVQTQSEIGDADALWELYLDGGGSKSTSNLKWLCRAADQGHSWARAELGRWYLHGINVKQDLIQAYLWYALAAQTGLVNAADELVVLRKQLSPEEIAEAHQLISNWQLGQCARELPLKIVPTKLIENLSSQ